MIHRVWKPKGEDFRTKTIWLTVYADLMTNLVLVFLALFGLVMMGNDALVKAVQSMSLEEISHISENPSQIEFDSLSTLLKEEITVSPDITISAEAGSTRIGFGENVLFPSGSAQLKESAGPVLGKLANYIRLLPYTIVVEGHTDNVPLKKGSPFKNNRELSLARAMEVVRLLAQQEKIPENQLAAAAYGSFRPISSNLTDAGKRLNRRVEISLFKDFPYEF